MPFGEVTSGQLIVHGYFEEGVWYRPFSGSRSFEERGGHTFIRSDHPEKKELDYQLSMFADFLPPMGAEIDVTCVEILRSPDMNPVLLPTATRGSDSQSLGLVLSKRDSESWERVGTFDVLTTCAWCMDTKATFKVL
jgi:hypothetical protein